MDRSSININILLRQESGGGTCTDSDFGAVDPYGDTCSNYTDHPHWCGNYDDADFFSQQMCCACGGGSTGGGNSVL